MTHKSTSALQCQTVFSGTPFTTHSLLPSPTLYTLLKDYLLHIHYAISHIISAKTAPSLGLCVMYDPSLLPAPSGSHRGPAQHEDAVLLL